VNVETVEREYEWVNLPNGRLRYQPVDVRERGHVADAWVSHYSMSMGASTNEHRAEIERKCADAGVDCTFNKHLMLKVNSRRHQQQLRRVILGEKAVNHQETWSR